VPRALRLGRWAFTPPFHPYPKTHEAPPGGLFSVTLSVAPSLRRKRPRLLRGLLPGGVRTFLSRANRERPPAVRTKGNRIVETRKQQRVQIADSKHLERLKIIPESSLIAFYGASQPK
jgi:hypothetical protein